MKFKYVENPLMFIRPNAFPKEVVTNDKQDSK